MTLDYKDVIKKIGRKYCERVTDSNLTYKTFQPNSQQTFVMDTILYIYIVWNYMHKS